MSDSVPSTTCGRLAEARDVKATLETELLLLPTGSMLVHNLTPTFAALLAQLGLEDASGRIHAPGQRPAAKTAGAVSTPLCDP